MVIIKTARKMFVQQLRLNQQCLCKMALYNERLIIFSMQTNEYLRLSNIHYHAATIALDIIYWYTYSVEINRKRDDNRY